MITVNSNFSSIVSKVNTVALAVAANSKATFSGAVGTPTYRRA